MNFTLFQWPGVDFTIKVSCNGAADRSDFFFTHWYPLWQAGCCDVLPSIDVISPLALLTTSYVPAFDVFLNSSMLFIIM